MPRQDAFSNRLHFRLNLYRQHHHLFTALTPPSFFLWPLHAAHVHICRLHEIHPPSHHLHYSLSLFLQVQVGENDNRLLRICFQLCFKSRQVWRWRSWLRRYCSLRRYRTCYASVCACVHACACDVCLQTSDTNRSASNPLNKHSFCPANPKISLSHRKQPAK